jgi:uncharacterized protein YcfL
VIIDLIIGSKLGLLVGASLLMLLVTSYKSRDLVVGQGNTDWQVRQSLNILSDNISSATSYQVSTNTYQALQAAASNSVTCYTSSAGAYNRYWYDSANKQLKKTTSTGTTTILLRNVDSVTLTYYVSGGSYYAASSSWVTTTSPNAPTSTELKSIGAVKMVVQMTVNGYTRQFTTQVRLRNSPI